MVSSVCRTRKSARAGLRAAFGVLGVLACLSLLLPGGASAALTDEQQAQVKASLDANKPYSEILSQGVGAGMSIGDLVGFMITSKGAGDKAVYDIVFAAISGGYDASAVVEAALRAGGNLQAVFNAAYAAGGSRDKITAGAKAAGLEDSQIADAFAGAAAGPGGQNQGGDTGGLQGSPFRRK